VRNPDRFGWVVTATMAPHSSAFLTVRDRVLALDEHDRARLASLFGAMTVAHERLGPLRDVLRSLASLDDADLERLAGWFSQHVNRWGQLPRDNAHSPGYAYATKRRA
jgi:hypothetical protein